MAASALCPLMSSSSHLGLVKSDIKGKAKTAFDQEMARVYAVGSKAQIWAVYPGFPLLLSYSPGPHPDLQTDILLSKAAPFWSAEKFCLLPLPQPYLGPDGSVPWPNERPLEIYIYI